MILTYDAVKYKAKKNELTAKDKGYFRDYIVCTLAMDRVWLATLSANGHRLMRFILGRTLSFQKRAEAISKRHFLKGIPGVCAPVGVSESTLDNAIRELQEQEFIKIHSFTHGNVESLTRIYEVDVDRIIGDTAYLTDEERENGMLDRREFDEKDDVLTPPKSRGGPPLNSGGRSNRYISKGDTNVSPPDRSAPGLSSPRKPRQQSKVDVNIKQSAAEIAAGLRATSQATRDTRVAASRDPAGKAWTKQQLQALLDKAHANVRDEGYATQRIVAIDKGRRLLQQRMADRGIKDAMEFFEYVLRNWASIAAAHSNATKRKRTEGADIGRSIHRSPNFDDLYQRLPYIATIFLNDEFRTAEAQIERDREEEKKRQGTQERQEAQRTRRQIARQRDLEREEQRKREEQALASRIERTRTPDRKVADEFSEMPTSFEEWQARRRNAK